MRFRLDGRWVVAVLMAIVVLGALWVLWLPAGDEPEPFVRQAPAVVDAPVPAVRVTTPEVDAGAEERASAPVVPVSQPAVAEEQVPYVCPVPRGFEGGSAELVTRVQGGKLDLPVAVALEKQGGDLVFSPRGTARQGVVRRGGEAVHTLRWSGEGRSTTCTVGPPPAPWTLAVRVDDPRDGAPLQLMGCGLPGVYEGGVVRVERPPGSSCVVQARRRDGVLVAESEAVELAPLDGEHVDLVLHVPAVDVGGIGAMVRSDPDGVVLTDVPPGTPAALAGLREGDLVVGADGQPLSGLRLPEQIARVTGPVGETVRLQVIRGGRVVELEVERSWVEPEDLDLE